MSTAFSLMLVVTVVRLSTLQAIAGERSLESMFSRPLPPPQPSIATITEFTGPTAYGRSSLNQLKAAHVEPIASADQAETWRCLLQIFAASREQNLSAPEIERALGIDLVQADLSTIHAAAPTWLGHGKGAQYRLLPSFTLTVTWDKDTQRTGCLTVSRALADLELAKGTVFIESAPRAQDQMFLVIMPNMLKVRFSRQDRLWSCLGDLTVSGM